MLFHELAFNDQDNLLHNMQDHIKNALLNLLNSRKIIFGDLDRYAYVKNSLLGYGMNELVHYNIESDKDVEALRCDILNAISVYEPRLSDLEVKHTRVMHDQCQGKIFFKIYAKIKDTTQDIALCSTVDTELNQIKIQQDEREDSFIF